MDHRSEPTAITLGWYTPREIQRLSVCEITTPVSFDAFGHPVPDGLYDPRMGPLERTTGCATCGASELRCPGHFGHIRLSRPVLSPLLFESLYGLLRASCSSCHNLKITDGERLSMYRRICKEKADASEDGESGDAEKDPKGEPDDKASRLDSVAEHVDAATAFLRHTGAKTKCPRCGARSERLRRGGHLRILHTTEADVRYITPGEIYDHITSLYIHEGAFLDALFRGSGPDPFFIDVLAVIPNRLRPARRTAGRIFEHSTNTQLARIMQFSAAAEADAKFWPDLQAYVLFYFDGASKQGSPNAVGLRQVLEKKEGLFRRNIMGKRVNYAARTVISPDAALHTREIGIPLVFASTLTIPERVTSFNADRLSSMVINGGTYPGASFVEADGVLVDARAIPPGARAALAGRLRAGNRVVWRHLLDGDPVLVNRQPTLHAAGLTVHTARILRNEKTLRLHYVNCKPYNADFDGDEMNIHVPQSVVARAEGKIVAHNDRVYLAPATGKPLRGLEQDHIVAASLLTMRDAFFSSNEFSQLVAAGKKGRVRMLAPCIVSPIPLFSGKQVITAVLQSHGVSLCFRAPTKQGSEDLVVRHGAMLSGILDKASIGASPHSFVHACGEIHGTAFCNDILTALSRVVNAYLSLRGFTVRFDDLLMSRDSDASRAEICLGAADVQIDCEATVRSAMNTCTSDVAALLSHGMLKKFPSNNMANIIHSGAKGSVVNLAQISCALGQQELEGQRVPPMASAKTLPCFRAGELSPGAWGYVYERFLTGLNPAPFFFHLMAGREGLIDTAVKTANSGYLQRSLVKHLEGAVVSHDGSVRIDGRVIQFAYGGDGLDVTKEAFLQNSEFFGANGRSLRERSSGLTGASVLRGPAGWEERFVRYYGDRIKRWSEDLVGCMRTRFLAAQVDAGTAVGVVAGQSIGEPSTQMTLNTFHLAGVGGRNVTLGIPRLREILMVASRSIKTPVITAPILMPAADTATGQEFSAALLAGAFRKVVVADCLDGVSIAERVVVREGEYRKRICITFDIVEHRRLCARALDASLPGLLEREIKRRISAVGVTEKIVGGASAKQDAEKSPGVDEDNESSSESSSESKQDIDSVLPKQKEEIDEDGDSQDEAEDGSGAEDGCTDSGTGLGSSDTRLRNIKRISTQRYSFEVFYPADFNVLLLPIVESICKRVVVREVGGFTDAAVMKDGLRGDSLHMEGSDFASLWGVVHGIDLSEALDLRRAVSNDIHAVERTFGIEAARATIVHEITSVFDVYGIAINDRHLGLVADYMTARGTFRPFSRSAFTMDDSLIQRMSFESCYTNLRSAATFHLRERIAGPSAHIAVGRAIPQGTGSVELYYNMHIDDE